MLRKIKLITLLLVALFLGANSCVSDSNLTPPYTFEDGYIMLALQAVTPTDANTRGESAHVPDGRPVAFNGGYLYFVSGNRIVQRYQVVTDATPTDIENGIINLNSMIGAGFSYIRVPGTVSRAIIVGNVQGRTPVDVGGSADAVHRAELDVNSQYDAENVNIWDSAPLVYLSGLTSEGYSRRSITLNLYPTVARIEMSELTAGGNIQSFTLRGIFIDNYHTHAWADGTLRGLNPTALSEDPLDFLRGGSTVNAPLYDWYFPTGIPSVNRSVVPERTPTSAAYRIVWGYNLFAERTRRDAGNNILNPNGSTMPRIVIRLSNVVVIDANGNPETLLDDRFLTIRGMLDEHNNPIRGLHARNVYYLGNVEFDAANLSRYPNRRPIDVRVRINTTQWTQCQVVVAGFRQPDPRNMTTDTPSNFTFSLANATLNGRTNLTHAGTVEYLWERLENGVWVAVGTWSDNANLSNAVAFTANISPETYFRRIARVAATPERMITSAPARVLAPARHYNFPKYVQIGTISGAPVFMTTRNIDFEQDQDDPGNFVFRGFALHPADPGMLFQWNRPYGWRAITHYSDVPVAALSNPNIVDFAPTQRWAGRVGGGWQTGVSWDPTFDVSPVWEEANNPCPAGWRIPFLSEFQLLNNTLVWLDKDAAAAANLGFQPGVRSSAHPQIFMPSFGARLDNGHLYRTSIYTMNHAQCDAGSVCAWVTSTNLGLTRRNIVELGVAHFQYGWGNRNHGQSIRCVRVGIAGVAIDNCPTAPLAPGATHTLTATITPATATNQNVTWSSSHPQFASVNANTGVVTAHAAGTTTITVTTAEGNQMATCLITVATPVTGVSIGNCLPATPLAINATRALTASITPANATNTAVTWTSSNPAIASVSATGVVTAHTRGEATITVTTADGGFTATCIITSGIPVTGISTIGNCLTVATPLGFTQTRQLTANVTPTNATNQTIIWSSSNTAIATVSATGLVTAGNTAGDVTITATTAEGGHQQQCIIRVVPLNATNVVINGCVATINRGGTVNLTATVTPANAIHSAVTWSSNNANVTVNANGVVSANNNATGSVIITATVTTSAGVPNVTSTCTMSIVVPITGVTIGNCNPRMPLQIGTTRALAVTPTPAGATITSVTWSSSNNAIATVNANGVVTGHANGTVTITALVNGTHTAQCHIEVLPSGVGLATSTTDPGVVIGGVRWATRNVDTAGTFVSNRYQVGGYFQWGTLLHGGTSNRWTFTNLTSTPAGWNPSATRFPWTIRNLPCPPGWRLPTQAELNSLIHTGTMITVSGATQGQWALSWGAGVNQLVIPTGGARHTNGFWSTNPHHMSRGFYWLQPMPANSQQPAPSPIGAHAGFMYMRQNDNMPGWGGNWERSWAMPIRCVSWW